VVLAKVAASAFQSSLDPMAQGSPHLSRVAGAQGESALCSPDTTCSRPFISR